MSNDNSILYDLVKTLNTKLDGVVDKQEERDRRLAQAHTEVMQAIATLQTQMTTVIGTGIQQGRIGKLEEDVKMLMRFRYKVLAFAGAVSAGLTGLWHIATLAFSHWPRK